MPTKNLKNELENAQARIQALTELLQEFSRFVDHKLYVNKDSVLYMRYRKHLDDLNIKSEDD